MKSKRHSMILNILGTRDIQTQEQLQEALLEEGYVCTQATISRDIKELNIIKEMTKFGTYRYVSASKEVAGTFSNRLNAILKQGITGYDHALNQVVIRTIPGLAGAAATAVDAMHLSFVLGTIAGDDTLLIIMRDINAAAAFCDEIRKQLN